VGVTALCQKLKNSCRFDRQCSTLLVLSVQMEMKLRVVTIVWWRAGAVNAIMRVLLMLISHNRTVDWKMSKKSWPNVCNVSIPSLYFWRHCTVRSGLKQATSPHAVDFFASRWHRYFHTQSIIEQKVNKKAALSQGNRAMPLHISINTECAVWPFVSHTRNPLTDV